MSTTTRPIAVLFFATLTPSACTTATHAVGTALPTIPDPAIGEPAGASVPRMASLGDRIEARPGVFITATATTQVVPDTSTGARIGHEPPVRIITVDVAYENQGTTPLADMNLLLGIGVVSTLDGAGLVSSFNGPDQSMGPVHPGQTGHLVLTVERGDGQPAYTGEPIQFAIPVPALLGETATGPFGPQAAYYTGTPTSK